jgi:hypothetical protein
LKEDQLSHKLSLIQPVTLITHGLGGVLL